MSGVEAKLVYEKYDEMMELLKGYREKIYQQWVGGVDQDCHFNLGQPLIQRDTFSNLIQVNFSKAVGPWPVDEGPLEGRMCIGGWEREGKAQAHHAGGCLYQQGTVEKVAVCELLTSTALLSKQLRSSRLE